MLKSACRRFRAELTPGDPHLQTCGACAAYAAAMARAAKRAPLPARLKSKLRAIPGAVEGDPRLPLPWAPLPNGLRGRLRGVTARPAGPRPLPVWVRSSRYAIAASYLMAVLIGTALGNPVDLGREAAGALSALVVAPLEQAILDAQTEGSEELAGWKDRVLETRNSFASSVKSSLADLGGRAAELSQSFRWIGPLNNRGPRREPSGPQGE